MKNVIYLLFLISCTQKYADYDLIRKVDFDHKNYQRPATVKAVVPEGTDHLDACFNQWLFFSNSEKKKDEAIPFVIRSLCPGKDYLINAELKETWWTTILFTRSCVEIEAVCAH